MLIMEMGCFVKDYVKNGHYLKIKRVLFVKNDIFGLYYKNVYDKIVTTENEYFQVIQKNF